MRLSDVTVWSGVAWSESATWSATAVPETWSLTGGETSRNMLATAGRLLDYTTDDMISVSVAPSALGYTGNGKERPGGAYTGTDVVTGAKSGEPCALSTDG